MDEFTSEEQKLLGPHISSLTDSVYAITIPGIAGAAMARLSRSPKGLRRIILDEFVREGQLDPQHSVELLERVLVGYGDDSVAQLEGAHVMCEGISNIAAKLLEDARIGVAPLEKSTRYVRFDDRNKNGEYAFYREPRIMASEFGEAYETALNRCFVAYGAVLERLIQFLAILKPIAAAEYDLRGQGPERIIALSDDRLVRQFHRTYREDLRTKACDTARVLLPAATLTNVGLYGNGQAYEHMLSRLYSSSLAEANALAKDIHKALNTVIPVYVKRAGRKEYPRMTDVQMGTFVARDFFPYFDRREEEVEMIEIAHDPRQFENQQVAAMLYAYSETSFREILRSVECMREARRWTIRQLYAGGRSSKRDRPGRALEWGYPLTYEILANFGIYRDLHRHRLLTQMRQSFTTRHGFDMPELIEMAGLADEVVRRRDEISDLYEKIRRHLGADVAQYVVLFGFKARWIMGMNDREALHMWELRTTKQGHPDYRRVCQKMHALLKQISPLRAEMMSNVDHNDYFWSRAESEARQRRKETALGIEVLEE